MNALCLYQRAAAVFLMYILTCSGNAIAQISVQFTEVETDHGSTRTK